MAAAGGEARMLVGARSITTLNGRTMELNPRPVDIPVTRPIGESLTGKDSQIDVAVKELLGTLTVGRR